MSTVRDTLNGALQGRLEAAFGRAAVGELLNLLAKKQGDGLDSLGSFRQDDVAKSKTAVALTYQGVEATAPVDVVAPRAGRIVGVVARLSADVTAGTATILPTIGGVGQAQTAVLSDTVQQLVQKFTTPIAFAEGDLLGLDITTSADLAPDASSELRSDLLVEWGSAGVTEENALALTANVATLANAPKALIDVEATAGTTTGRKKIRQGAITGDQALVRATGEVIWDGTTGLLFAAVDVVTAVRVTYTQAADDVASSLQSDVDTP